MIAILVLCVRVALGGVFLVAGALKIGHFDLFASQIAGFQILPQPVIAPLARSRSTRRFTAGADSPTSLPTTAKLARAFLIRTATIRASISSIAINHRTSRR